MSTIDNYELPSRIGEIFIEIINSVKTSSILLYSKLHPELIKGFRPNKINHKIVRQHLLAQLKSTGPLDASIMALLAQDGFNLEFVAVFSSDALGAHFTDFAGVFGADNMLAAMLVDSREKVRSLAISYLRGAKNSDTDLPNKAEAKANLLDGLTPVVRHFAHISDMGGGHDVMSRAVQGESEISQRKAKPKDISSKSFKKMEKSLLAKIITRENEVDNLAGRLAREQTRTGELDRALREAETQIDKLQGEFDGKIESGVRHAMQSAVRRWLVAPGQLDSVISKIKQSHKADNDIFNKVSRILKTQADIDRNYGNRKYLKQRLADLQEAQVQLLEAARYSLNPVPELSVINAELDTEKNSIAQMLGTDLPKNSLLAKLTVSINQVQGADDLERITILLNALGAEKLLNEQDRQTLLLQLDGCRERFYEQYRPQAMAPEMLLQEVIGKEGEQLFLIDGYNVLFGLPEYFSLFFDEDGRPGELARSKLLHYLDLIFRKSSCLVNVFFDGEIREEANFSPCVKEIYSGGGQAHIPDRADRAIVDFLERRLPSARKETVITNDRELQGRVQVLGAAIMPLAQFAPLLAVAQKK